MTDQSEPTAGGLVAAVLAVMPMWDGEIITGTKTERTEYAPDEPRDVCARSGEPLIPDEYETPVFGDPKPEAAKCAAAVLRHLADVLRRADPMWGGSYDDDDLAALADEIDPPKDAR